MLTAAMWMSAALMGATAIAGPRGAESAPAPAGLDRAYARRIALVVGVDRYPSDPDIEDLRYASKDAQDIARVLADPRWGDFDETVELSDGLVSRDEFWDVFGDVTEDIGPEDTFVFYFAGHGTLDLTRDGTQLYLIPSDGQKADPSATSISLDRLEDAVAALPARQRVVMIDACHSMTKDARSMVSDETRARLIGLRGGAPSPAPRDVSASEFFMYASAFNQPAQEDDAFENGVYTHFLLRALKGEADQNSDGLIEVMELHHWVSAQTEEHSGGLQVPQYQARTVGREAIFLSGDASRRAEAEANYRRRLAQMASVDVGANRGLDTTTTPAGRDGWDGLTIGAQIGYARRLYTAQVQAQREALGETVMTQDLDFSVVSRQRLGAAAIRPFLAQELSIIGLDRGALTPRVGALGGISLAPWLSGGVGARWSPDIGGRWMAAAGVSPTVGPIRVPIWVTADGGSEEWMSFGITVGMSRSVR
ncbi:MAG: caspase family protein [Myxococcota bacterium]